MQQTTRGAIIFPSTDRQSSFKKSKLKYILSIARIFFFSVFMSHAFFFSSLPILIVFIFFSFARTAGKRSAADHMLQYYLESIENALRIHEAFKKEQHEIRRAYGIYMNVHYRTTLAWNEGQ